MWDKTFDTDMRGLKVAPGMVFGSHLETDDFCETRPGRYVLNIEKYKTKIVEAIREVNLMRLVVDRVTILKGVVQAHPKSEFHHKCPFCYPENKTAKQGYLFVEEETP